MEEGVGVEGGVKGGRIERRGDFGERGRKGWSVRERISHLSPEHLLNFRWKHHICTSR